MGISPRHGSHAALPIACDALNARTVAVRKYHCIFCVSSPASRYTCFPARCWSLGCPGGDNLTRIASWRTHRMARRKRNVSDLPYAAPPLSCAAFFVKVQNGFAAASAAERKRGREKASRRCGLFLCLKGEDSHHQFCLQPFPNVVVYAKIDVPALVVQLCDKEAIEVQKILPFLSDTWPLCRIGRAVIRASQSCRQSCNKSQCPACGCRSHHSCTHAPQFSRSFPAREWGSVLQRQGACGQCP